MKKTGEVNKDDEEYGEPRRVVQFWVYSGGLFLLHNINSEDSMMIN